MVGEQITERIIRLEWDFGLRQLVLKQLHLKLLRASGQLPGGEPVGVRKLVKGQASTAGYQPGRRLHSTVKRVRFQLIKKVTSPAPAGSLVEFHLFLKMFGVEVPRLINFLPQLREESSSCFKQIIARERWHSYEPLHHRAEPHCGPDAAVPGNFGIHSVQRAPEVCHPESRRQ